MDRRLTAILSYDAVGYSLAMGRDEAGTLDALKSDRRTIIDPKTGQHGGRTIKLMGDGALIEFASVVDAVIFAIAMQCAVADRNAELPEDQRRFYRIGINVGDVVVDGEDIYGDGVNIASRLEALAEPGGICIHQNVRDQLRGKLDIDFDDLGEVEVKNIERPVRAFRVTLNDKAAAIAARPVERAPALKSPSRVWQAAAGILASLVLIGGVFWWQSPAPEFEPVDADAMAFPLPDKPSIAVLPFDNMSDDASQEYFADGMTEDLITDLSKLSGLFVIARNSSFSYKGQAVQVRQVAEELGVRYVLEGSVRRVGDQVRINAQLIDATTGGHVWAERYDGTLDDVFTLQDNVTQEIIAALSVTLTGEEAAREAQYETVNAVAHDAYLQGWAHYKLLTAKELTKAVPFFEEAIRLDPGYPQAHAALASVYWDAYQNDWAFDLRLASFQAEERSNAHLEEALKSPVPLAHALQARIMASHGLYDLAIAEAEKAVALDSNDAAALAGLADALIFAGRPGAALDAIRKAMRLDPHHPPDYLITLGAAEFGADQFEAAAATFERAATRNSGTELPLIYLASSYGHLGRMTEAEAAIEEANGIRNGHGMNELSLTGIDPTGFNPGQGKLDFSQFGNDAAQERLRAGLSNIPALTWQSLITTRVVFDENNKSVGSYKIEGALKIDLATAKSLYDRGVVFIDTSPVKYWRTGHIPGSINLTGRRNLADPTTRLLTEKTLGARLRKSEEVVFCRYLIDSPGTSFGAAKAIKWGYQKVYYFNGGAPAWKAAGYPIKTGE